MNSKTKKRISLFLKTGIFLLVVWYVYRLLTANTALRDFKELMASASPKAIILSLVLVFILMLLNWFIESFKWKYICQQYHTISSFKAVQSVFCGLAWAVFTPNRIGEYGGRVLFLPPNKRVFGVIGMAIGAVSLMVITNVVGIWSLTWFLHTYLDLRGLAFFSMVLLALLVSAFFFLLYFRLRVLNDLLLKVKFLKKYQRFFSVLQRYDSKKLVRIFLYSLARFTVFSSQYCLLMQVLLPELPFWPMLLMVFLLFFVQSALPSLDLFDVGVRSITANYFFGFLTDQSVAVMAIAACIWLVNLIIPAVIGSFFTFKINFFGTTTAQ